MKKENNISKPTMLIINIVSKIWTVVKPLTKNGLISFLKKHSSEIVSVIIMSIVASIMTEKSFLSVLLFISVIIFLHEIISGVSKK